MKLARRPSRSAPVSPRSPSNALGSTLEAPLRVDVPTPMWSDAVVALVPQLPSDQSASTPHTSPKYSLTSSPTLQQRQDDNSRSADSVAPAASIEVVTANVQPVVTSSLRSRRRRSDLKSVSHLELPAVSSSKITSDRMHRSKSFKQRLQQFRKNLPHPGVLSTASPPSSPTASPPGVSADENNASALRKGALSSDNLFRLSFRRPPATSKLSPGASPSASPVAGSPGALPPASYLTSRRGSAHAGDSADSDADVPVCVSPSSPARLGTGMRSLLRRSLRRKHSSGADRSSTNASPTLTAAVDSGADSDDETLASSSSSSTRNRRFRSLRRMRSGERDDVASPGPSSPSDARPSFFSSLLRGSRSSLVEKTPSEGPDTLVGSKSSGTRVNQNGRAPHALSAASVPLSSSSVATATPSEATTTTTTTVVVAAAVATTYNDEARVMDLISPALVDDDDDLGDSVSMYPPSDDEDRDPDVPTVTTRSKNNNGAMKAPPSNPIAFPVRRSFDRHLEDTADLDATQSRGRSNSSPDRPMMSLLARSPPPATNSSADSFTNVPSDTLTAQVRARTAACSRLTSASSHSDVVSPLPPMRTPPSTTRNPLNRIRDRLFFRGHRRNNSSSKSSNVVSSGGGNGSPVGLPDSSYASAISSPSRRRRRASNESTSSNQDSSHVDDSAHSQHANSSSCNSEPRSPIFGRIHRIFHRNTSLDNVARPSASSGDDSSGVSAFTTATSGVHPSLSPPCQRHSIRANTRPSSTSKLANVVVRPSKPIARVVSSSNASQLPSGSGLGKTNGVPTASITAAPVPSMGTVSSPVLVGDGCLSDVSNSSVAAPFEADTVRLGVLEREEGGPCGSWKSRMWRLTPTSLEVYKRTSVPSRRDRPLVEVRLYDVLRCGETSESFLVGQYAFEIDLPGTRVFVRAKSALDRDQWIQAIVEQVSLQVVIGAVAGGGAGHDQDVRDIIRQMTQFEFDYPESVASSSMLSLAVDSSAIGDSHLSLVTPSPSSPAALRVNMSVPSLATSCTLLPPSSPRASLASSTTGPTAALSCSPTRAVRSVSSPRGQMPQRSYTSFEAIVSPREEYYDELPVPPGSPPIVRSTSATYSSGGTLVGTPSSSTAGGSTTAQSPSSMRRSFSSMITRQSPSPVGMRRSYSGQARAGVPPSGVLRQGFTLTQVFEDEYAAHKAATTSAQQQIQQHRLDQPRQPRLFGSAPDPVAVAAAAASISERMRNARASAPSTRPILDRMTVRGVSGSSGAVGDDNIAELADSFDMTPIHHRDDDTATPVLDAVARATRVVSDLDANPAMSPRARRRFAAGALSRESTFNADEEPAMVHGERVNRDNLRAASQVSRLIDSLALEVRTVVHRRIANRRVLNLRRSVKARIAATAKADTVNDSAAAAAVAATVLANTTKMLAVASNVTSPLSPALIAAASSVSQSLPSSPRRPAGDSTPETLLDLLHPSPARRSVDSSVSGGTSFSLPSPSSTSTVSDAPTTLALDRPPILSEIILESSV